MMNAKNQQQQQQEEEGGLSTTRDSTTSSCASSRFTSQECKEIVRSLADGIETDVAHLTSESALLSSPQSSNVEEDIAFFRRKEIQVGKILGKGSFCIVYEVTGLDTTARTNANNNQRGCDQQRQGDSRRQAGLRSCRDASSTAKKCYAMKHMRKHNLRNPQNFIHRAADLIIEAKTMSKFNHPNILKIRGLPVEGSMSFRTGRYDEYFIIMDRLDDTLDNRIWKWREEQYNTSSTNNNMGDATTSTMETCTNMQQQQHQRLLLETSVHYAKQIACALGYLHDRKIIYRDLKPENIGLCRCEANADAGKEVVQLFDFGLCREMPVEYKTENDVFLMSVAGSKRYMAPEIMSATNGYNLKVDSYSWALVFYEMLTLTKPYKDYNETSHMKYVCKRGVRPQLEGYNFPIDVINVLTKAWRQSVRSRLTMKRILQLMETMTLGTRTAGATTDATVLTADKNANAILGTTTTTTTTRVPLNMHKLDELNPVFDKVEASLKDLTVIEQEQSSSNLLDLDDKDCEAIFGKQYTMDRCDFTSISDTLSCTTDHSSTIYDATQSTVDRDIL